ncbi:hypothetical protein H6G74_28070 [Nostoc spongiaeforme FACHB-130]|uniref:Uncharacterized protein n=1 Tax=Nostoc spongiaeforme FACHB-130 TaxID=1357510 RepID=A0ABR8G4J7_9NOSO|nr:hypothetical protein [Nostoc spongiaeforme]MBD2598153.1 hypothetical protein [Nostoc spongiaeforme FACHB-130]
MSIKKRFIAFSQDLYRNWYRRTYIYKLTQASQDHGDRLRSTIIIAVAEYGLVWWIINWLAPLLHYTPAINFDIKNRKLQT